MLDFVLKDHQTFEGGNSSGDSIRIWNFGTWLKNVSLFQQIVINQHTAEMCG